MKHKKGWERLGPQPFKVIVVILFPWPIDRPLALSAILLCRDLRLLPPVQRKAVLFDILGQIRGVAPIYADAVDVIRVVILARPAPLAVDERVNEVCAHWRPVDSSPDGAV